MRICQWSTDTDIHAHLVQWLTRCSIKVFDLNFPLKLFFLLHIITSFITCVHKWLDYYESFPGKFLLKTHCVPCLYNYPARVFARLFTLPSNVVVLNSLKHYRPSDVVSWHVLWACSFGAGVFLFFIVKMQNGTRISNSIKAGIAKIVETKPKTPRWNCVVY